MVKGCGFTFPFSLFPFFRETVRNMELWFRTIYQIIFYPSFKVPVIPDPSQTDHIKIKTAGSEDKVLTPLMSTFIVARFVSVNDGGPV